MTCLDRDGRLPDACSLERFQLSWRAQSILRASSWPVVSSSAFSVVASCLARYGAQASSVCGQLFHARSFPKRTNPLVDKNIVGTANALTGGFGNAGGGVTYFVMPAIFLSLESMGHTPSVAWRISYIVPGILIVLVAVGMIVCCPDCPSGKWSTRLQAAENNLRAHGVEGTIVEIPGQVTESEEGKEKSAASDTESPSGFADEEKKLGNARGAVNENEAPLDHQQMLDTARGEVIQKLGLTETVKVCLSLQTLTLAAAYFCSFGGELAINSILGSYYAKNLDLGIQQSGNLAAIFGIFNAIFRPLGGFASDYLYKKTNSLWAKKMLLHGYLVITAGFLVAIGLTDPHDRTALICLICVGMAFFLEGANGLAYGLVPHVHPHANGVVSGFVGAAGNAGGIVLAIIFRYSGTDYAQGFWAWGIVCFALQVAVCWIRPIPKDQVGGR